MDDHVAQAHSYQGRLLSKISIFGALSAKSQKNGEQDYSPFGQSLVEIEFCSPSISNLPTSKLPPQLIILHHTTTTTKQHE